MFQQLIEINEEHTQVMVSLTDEIYIDEATILREKLIPYVEQGYRTFVFDFSNVTYIDSSGIGVLVAIHKRTKPDGGGVILKGVNRNLKELFDLAKLTSLFTIQ